LIFKNGEGQGNSGTKRKRGKHGEGLGGRGGKEKGDPGVSDIGRDFKDRWGWDFQKYRTAVKKSKQREGEQERLRQNKKKRLEYWGKGETET